jgi:hypothetical protein
MEADLKAMEADQKAMEADQNAMEADQKNMGADQKTMEVPSHNKITYSIDDVPPWYFISIHILKIIFSVDNNLCKQLVYMHAALQYTV